MCDPPRSFRRRNELGMRRRRSFDDAAWMGHRVIREVEAQCWSEYGSIRAGRVLKTDPMAVCSPCLEIGREWVQDVAIVFADLVIT